MNYTICLDPTSIGFSTSDLSSNGFSIYTDADGFAIPIAQNIPASQLFPPPIGNCPFTVFGVPTGSNQLLILDQCSTTTSASISVNLSSSTTIVDTTCCYALIDIDPCGTWCTECSIGFDTINTSPIGRIIAGNLESSCGTVTDYVIGWYRNGDYSSPAILTGAGNTFNYQFTHPLDSTTGPLVLDGNYEGIIHDIIIGGTQYSNFASGSGVGIPIPFESCFGTVVVSPYSCDNGVFPLPYTHQISLATAGNNLPVPPISATYLLSSSTDYFAYQFLAGTQVADELEIKFISGDPNSTTNPTLYSEPIYLEKIEVGSGIPSTINIPSNINNNTYPKKFGSTNFKRVLNLTESLERTNGDKLEITVTPLGTETEWSLKMQCLEDFDCADCHFNDNPPRLIKAITLERNAGLLSSDCPGTTGSCAAQNIKMNISGCFTSNTDLFNTYIQSTVDGTNSVIFNPVNVNNSLLTPPGQIDQPGYFTYGIGTTACDTIETDWTGSIEKYNDPTVGISSTGFPLGAISMSFNNVDFYNHYKNKIIGAENAIFTEVGPIETDCSNKNYYIYYKFTFPNPSAPSIPCGDGVTTETFYIHRTAYPDILFDDTNYEIFIPMPEMEVCYTCSEDIDCCNIDYLCNRRDLVNISSFGSSNQVSTTTYLGSRYQNVIIGQKPRFITTLSPSSFTNEKSGYTSIPIYPMETLPFQPSPIGGWVNYPNISASVCPDWENNRPTLWNTSLGNYYGYVYGYWTEFPNLTASLANSMNDDFRIYASVQNNSGLKSSSLADSLLIYEYSSSVVTVHEPSFFEGGSPTLTIEPF